MRSMDSHAAVQDSAEHKAAWLPLFLSHRFGRDYG